MSNENDPQAKAAPSSTVDEILAHFAQIEPIMVRLKADHVGEDSRMLMYVPSVTVGSTSAP